MVPPISFDVTIARTYDNVTKGYAFANFDDPISARRAVDNLNGMQIEHQTLYVSRCLSKSERVSTSSVSTSYRAPGTNLYVKNFPLHWGNEELATPFHVFGQVTGVKVMVGPNGHSRGFGFVSLATAESAELAMTALHDKYTFSNGKRLYVRHHEKKEERMKRLWGDYIRKGYANGDRGWNLRYRYEAAAPLMPSAGSFITHALPIMAAPNGSISGLPVTTACLFNPHSDRIVCQSPYFQSGDVAIEETSPAFTPSWIVKTAADISISEDNKAEEHLISSGGCSQTCQQPVLQEERCMTLSTELVSQGPSKIPHSSNPQTCTFEESSKNPYVHQGDKSGTALAETGVEVSDDNSATQEQVSSGIASQPQRYSVASTQQGPTTTMNNFPNPQNVSHHRHKSVDSKKLMSGMTNPMVISTASGELADEQITKTNDRRSYAHIVGIISREKDIQEESQMVQAKATAACNSMDQQELVDKSGNITSDKRTVIKSIAPLHENKAYSNSAKSGHIKRSFRRGVQKYQENSKAVQHRKSARRIRQKDISNHKTNIATQKGHRVFNSKRNRMPVTVKAVQSTREVANMVHDNNSERSAGGTSFHSEKQFHRSAADGKKQVRSKVTTKQLPSTCLRLDNWKVAGGVKKVEEFFREKIGYPPMNVQKWPSAELSTSWFCVFHTKDQAAFAMNKLDGYKLPSGSVLKLIALQPKKAK